VRTRWTWVSITMLLAGCGAAPAAPAGIATATARTTSGPSPAPAAAEPLALAPPGVELGAANHATAFGEGVAFDGVAEGLYWPALAHAFASKGQGAARVVLAAPRDARVLDVLRAVWTLREVDVEVQTLGPGNEVRPLVLAKRPATRPDGPTCHAAVFVGPQSRLRVALPGGSVGVRDAAELVTSLGAGARSCTVRWVAVGAESPSEAWGGVFDVAYTVQASQAAGKARVVLGEPVVKKP
jgi:hypothetical protein